MIIRVLKHECRFVQIDKDLLNNPVLSFRAKGVLCYLLSKPDKWEVRIEQVAAASGEKKGSIRAVFKELEERGYAKLESIAGHNGRWCGKGWIVAESPALLSQSPTAQNSDVGETRRSEEPAVNSNTCLNTNTESESNTPRVDLFPSEKDSAEELYDLYPRKAARKESLREIRKALKKTPFPELKAKVTQLSIMWGNADLAYCPYASTWFHQERYQDPPESWAPKPESNNGQPPIWKRIELLETAINDHPARPNSLNYDERKLTDAMRADLKTLRGKLAKLKEEQVAAL